VACTFLSPIIEAALVKLRFSSHESDRLAAHDHRKREARAAARSALTPNKVTASVVAIRSFA